jgi:ABC-type phosphate/phosphonate transport system ATPase subunit
LSFEAIFPERSTECTTVNPTIAKGIAFVIGRAGAGKTAMMKAAP